MLGLRGSSPSPSGTCTSQPWVSLCVKTLGRPVWGFSRVGRSSRNQRVPAPQSQNKRRCLGSARPDGAGGSPGTARRAITARGGEVRRPRQRPHASGGSPLADSRGKSGGVRGVTTSSGAWLPGSTERGRATCARTTSGRAQQTRCPDGGGGCWKRDIPGGGGPQWGGSGPASPTPYECARGSSLEAASGASEGLGEGGPRRDARRTGSHLHSGTSCGAAGA